MVKAIVFSDFDGTITLEDSNDNLSDTFGISKQQRLDLFKDIVHSKGSFRDSFQTMMDNINLPIEECIKFLVGKINLDPGFKTCLEYCNENNICVVIISSGMRPIIKALLEHLLGKEEADKLTIVCNETEILDEKTGKWTIKYKNPESIHGHDKSISIDELKQATELSGYRLDQENEKPIYFYCGDGVSDVTAAAKCDLLFARDGKDLITFCERGDIPYHKFQSWADILKGIQDVLENGKDIKDLIENQKK
ncbi:hypothetical protein QEN19_003322 [Hanseniaspora menglaensis]